MAKPLPDISLPDGEREELHRIIRKSTSPQHKVLRAKIMLLAEKKLPTEAIMKELNISKNTAVKWRKRFSQNQLDGLHDEQRLGKPRTYYAEVRLKIATEECRPPVGRFWPLNMSGIQYTLTGVDANINAIEIRQTKQKDLDETIIGDLRYLNLEENKYDIIYNSFVLEHIDGAEHVLSNFLKWLNGICQ